MKTQIHIIETKDGIKILTPFSESNNEVFRARGGKYDRSTRHWVFPRTKTTIAMIVELFGGESALVLVRVPNDRIVEFRNQWMLGGYVIAYRHSHDEPVRVPTGVQLEKGEWQPTGGDADNPRVTGSDCVITLVVRRSFAEREQLEIVESEDSNPLASVETQYLIEELQRRGVIKGDRVIRPAA